MSNEAKETTRLSQRAKFLVDFGPLAVFMGAYFLGQKLAPAIGGAIGRDWAIKDGEEMYLAISLFMPAFAVAFGYSVWRERRVAPMLLVSAVVIGVLGGLTLILRDKTFFFMKPTIVYALFSSVLLGSLWAGRNALKSLFDGALTMPDDAWRVLTKRYAVFFVLLAAANEVAWRWLMRDCDLTATATCPGEPTWVNLKVFGFTAINLVFAGLQTPFLMKHVVEEPSGSG